MKMCVTPFSGLAGAARYHIQLSTLAICCAIFREVSLAQAVDVGVGEFIG
jgi:hypothetical protein